MSRPQSLRAPFASTRRWVMLRSQLSWARWCLRRQERRLRRETALLLLQQELAVTQLLLAARRQETGSLPLPQPPEPEELTQLPPEPEPPMLLTPGSPEPEEIPPPAEMQLLQLLRETSPSQTSHLSGASSAPDSSPS